MQTRTFTGAGFCVRLAAWAALPLITLTLAPAAKATPITVIAKFNVTNGQQPMGGVTFDAAGNMYGTTYRGDSGVAGANGVATNAGGVVWEIAHGTHTITDLAVMDGYGSDPGEPYGNVSVDADGTVYGTTSSGGTASRSVYGEVFKVVAGSGTLTDIGDIGVGANPGWHPVAGVTRDAAGDLFGTTQYGSTNNAGTIWEIPAGGTLTTLASLLGTSPNGREPVAGVTLDGQGNLYGTTQHGGVNGTASSGTVWELPRGSDTVLPLASFGQQDGDPVGDVTVDAGGDVYGTTTSGGANRAGLVWEVVAGTNTITNLASFAGNNITTSINGYGPSGNVVLDGAGNLFGTTTNGGTSAFGTVWEIPAGGTLTTIASFSGVNGSAPYGNVMLDAQGNLFGTTSAGGPANAGVVWEMAGVGVGGGTAVPTALTLTPNPAFPDTTINAAVTFSQSVPAGTSVAITRNGTALAALVTPTTGTTLAFTLPLPGYLNGSYTIGATLNGQTASQILTVIGDPNKPVPISLVFLPSPATPGVVLTGTITLSGPAPAGGLNVEIFQNGTDLGSVAVAAGASTVLLGQTLTAGTYTYAAVENGVQVTTTLTVAPTVSTHTTHILWTNTNGQASFWNYDTIAGTYTHNEYGPFAGYTPKTIADGSDGKTRVLWDNTDGSMSLWNLDNSTGAFTHAEFGPYAGWTAAALSVGTDNTPHILWVNASGVASIWNYSTQSQTFTHQEYGPYAGYTPKAIADGPDGKMRVVWDNVSGSASLWSLNNVTGAYTHAEFGPFAGYTATAVSAGANGMTHILWTNANGTASVWDYSTSYSTYTHNEYGPFTGYGAMALADGSGGKTRVLWDNTNGSMSLWSLDNSVAAFGHFEFGPYVGWTATALSAAP